MTAFIHEDLSGAQPEPVGDGPIRSYAVDPLGRELLAGSYDVDILPGTELDTLARKPEVLGEVEVVTLARNAFNQQISELQESFPGSLLELVDEKLAAVHQEAVVKSVPPVQAAEVQVEASEPTRRLTLDELERLAEQDEMRTLFAPEDKAFVPVHEERHTKATKHPTKLTGRELHVAEAAVALAIPNERLARVVTAGLESRRTRVSRFAKTAGVLAVAPFVLLASWRR